MADWYAPRQRPLAGLLAGVAGVGAIVAALEPFDVSRATPAIALIVPVVAAALIGGRTVAVWTAVTAAVAYDLWFLPPKGTLRVALFADVVAGGLFLGVALATGSVVAEQTRRHRRESARAVELARMHAELTAALAERDRLEAQTREVAVLQEVDRQRRSLLRAVSHDLRTPLGTIRVVASDLRDGTAYDAPTRGELLDLVVHETERLDRIVTNLLSMSRIEAGAFAPDLQPCDPCEVLKKVATRLAPLFVDTHLDVSCPADLPLVLGDATQLDLVFTNLLENAARHAPAGSTVRVSARRVGDAVAVDVTDDGLGVDADDRVVIFEPFHSRDGRAGLGLPICRAIVDAHGGTVAVVGGPNGGAQFCVVIPGADPARRG